jgi:hypothetical protein
VAGYNRNLLSMLENVLDFELRAHSAAAAADEGVFFTFVDRDAPPVIELWLTRTKLAVPARGSGGSSSPSVVQSVIAACVKRNDRNGARLATRATKLWR